MKKIFITLCVVLVSLGASAQKGEQNIGAHVLYGMQMSNIGLGVKYQNCITDVVRLEAVGDYYLETDGYSMFDVNVNGHYLFPLSDKITAYPLVGINYTNWKNGNSDSRNSGVGLNVGGGVQYKLADKICIGAELKYQTVNGFSTPIVGAGVIFTL